MPADLSSKTPSFPARVLARHLPAAGWVPLLEGEAYLGPQARLVMQLERNEALAIPSGSWDPELSSEVFAEDLLALIGEDLTVRDIKALVRQLLRLLGNWPRAGSPHDPAGDLLRELLSGFEAKQGGAR